VSKLHLLNIIKNPAPCKTSDHIYKAGVRYTLSQIQKRKSYNDFTGNMSTASRDTESRNGRPIDHKSFWEQTTLGSLYTSTQALDTI